MPFYDEFRNRVMASYPAIYVVAREDWRAEQEIEKIANNLKVPYLTWTVTSGFKRSEPIIDPLEALKKILRIEGIFVFKNFHRFMDDPEMIQVIKDTIQIGKAVGQTIVFLSNVWKLPDELLDDITRMDFGLPDRVLIEERVLFIHDGIIDKVKEKDKVLSREKIDALVEAGLGMTTWEVENALSLSAAETSSLDPKIISREKAMVVSKSGILEFQQVVESMSNVGGLDNLKTWLGQRKKAFSKEARSFGLPEPKGILLIGPPGTGKSLTAKAVASEWGIPLIRFDLGKLFAGIVGASEENVRRAIALAEAVAPVVLWIDEIEKGMAGSSSSGQTDSGVTSRVFGTLITWMQERKRPVFVVATANNVSNLPPELMRAGRWDEIFSIDLPSEQEREIILAIHLRKKNRTPENFNLSYIAKESAQFSGAELENVVVKALFKAFSEGREVTTDDLMYGVTNTTPLAVTRKEEIDAMRKWAETRAVPASSSRPPEIKPEGEEIKRRKLRMTVEEIGPEE